MPELNHALTPVHPLRCKLVPRASGLPELSVRHLIRMLEPRKLLCQRLTPSERETARPNSLSSRHGLGVFPFHTDFVVADVPPRYIMLVASRPRAAATLVFDVDELSAEFGIGHLQRCLFLKRGRTSSYCRLLTVSNGEPLFRYNQAVMTPKNREAHDVAEFIEHGTKRVSRIDWTEVRIAVIDNWNALHSRDACELSDGVGLRRFAIWGDVHDLGS